MNENDFTWKLVFELCEKYSDPDWIYNDSYEDGKFKILEGTRDLKSKEFSMIKKAIMSAKMRSYSSGNYQVTYLLRNIEKEDKTYNDLKSQFGSCYIATFAYGDYENYQVVKLRNFRDNKLSRSDFGRFFIKSYYFISPFLVKLFSDNTIVRFYSRRVLDAIISYLEKRNYI